MLCVFVTLIWFFRNELSWALVNVDHQLQIIRHLSVTLVCSLV